MPVEHSLDAARETAALHALGALSAAEARAFEQHLGAGCSVCRRELDGFRAVADMLVHAAEPQTPRPALRTRILERAAAESTSAHVAVLDREGLRFVRGTQLGWDPGSVPAVETKTLHVDAHRGYVTQLVRMDPGAVLQPHRHADVEESYLLEGDLLVSGVLMHAGDYCCAQPGSFHRGVETRGGCVFITVRSLRDEVLSEETVAGDG